MRRMRAFLLRLAGMFRPCERELADEIESHLDFHVADNIRAGMTPEEARRAAILKLGGIEQTKESYRERSGLPVLETMFHDLRYALRMLRRSPGFTAVAVLSLSLGIGANTAIFSVMDAFLLRLLPVRDPQQLVVFDPVYVGRSNNGLLPYPTYERLATLGRFFSNMTAVLPVDRWNVTIQGRGGGVDPGQCSVGVVTGSFFETLGVHAAIGRTFGPEDDTGVGGHPVAVVSYSYWDRKFGRDADILGRTFTLNATTYTVIGVTPPGFTGEWVGRPTDFWVPVAMLSLVMTELPPDPKRGGRMAYHVVARLRPGVERGQAQAAAQAVHQQYIHEISSPNPAMRDDAQLMHLAMVPAARGFSPQRQLLTQPLAIVSMMVGLVLLIACINLANLLLARSAARRREITVRLAIGAGRARIVCQLLTESLVLAGMGGIVGLLFAWRMGNTLLNFAGSGPVRRVDAAVLLNLHPDSRVLLFTLVLCLATGILFGLAPAIRASKVSIPPGLGERGSSGSAAGKFCKALIVLQVALSVLLLIGAGLFVRTLRSLKSQDLGIDRTHVMVAWIAPGQTGRWGAATAQLYSAIEQRLSAVPGVAAVSPNVYGMFQGSTNPGTILNVPGYVPASDADTRAPWSIIGTRFFDALGLSLVAGRNLTELDTAASPQVAIVNQSMARHFFGNDNPLGRHF